MYLRKRSDTITYMGTKRKEITLSASEGTCAGPFWDGFCEIGDCEELWIDGTCYKVDITGLKEWFLKADRYDPYTDMCEFIAEGFDEWVNEGYRHALMLRKTLPKDIDLYYGFWKNFGDAQWYYCKAYMVI